MIRQRAVLLLRNQLPRMLKGELKDRLSQKGMMASHEFRLSTTLIQIIRDLIGMTAHQRPILLLAKSRETDTGKSEIEIKVDQRRITSFVTTM